MRPLLIIVALSALLGGAAAPWLPCLELVNLDASTGWIVPLGLKGEFNITCEHSVYVSRVSERFQVQQGKIVLEAVETSHQGVAGYYGFEGDGPVYPLDREFRQIVLRIRMGRGHQSIGVRGQLVELRELGAPGDRLRIRPARCSLLGPILKRLDAETGWAREDSKN
ncbi:MAG: hypothetical protein ACUVS3_05300 [Thermodesulfobacteriota bacterium]